MRESNEGQISQSYTFARQLESQDHVISQIYVARLEAMRLWPNIQALI